MGSVGAKAFRALHPPSSVSILSRSRSVAAPSVRPSLACGVPSRRSDLSPHHSSPQSRSHHALHTMRLTPCDRLTPHTRYCAFGTRLTVTPDHLTEHGSIP